jgi:lysine N6-hydroxylase
MSAAHDGQPASILRLPERSRRYHTIGIGAGPANLSLAALFESVAPHRIALFEQSSGSAWHPTLLHQGVRMQTAWIKDLVSLVDPQHRLSFLSYLVSTGRVYAFLSAQYEAIPRMEYARYLAWAGEQLDDVHYDTRVDRVAFDGEGFSVYGDDGLLARSEHLVLGVGTRAKLPAPFEGVERVVLADHLAGHAQRLAREPDARVAVVGGGQTGAECVLELLRLGLTDIWWFGRRPWFQTMEDSPSANDLYRPSYREFLPQLPDEARRETIARQVLTSDGIADATLREIYQRNYEAMLETGHHPVTLLPGRDVVAAQADDLGLTLTCAEAAGEVSYDVRHAVVAAGRQPAPLPFDDDLRELVELDDRGEPIVQSDYSLRWNGPARHKIFAQNRAASVHGLADKNLSLLAERSATIINSLFEREVFTLRDECVTTRWGAPPAPGAPLVLASPLPPELAQLDEEFALATEGAA